MGHAIRAICAAAAAALALVACKGEEKGPPAPAATATPAPPASGTTPLGVQWERLRPGTGEKPQPGQKVRMKFTAQAGQGAKDEGEVTFVVGSGRTMPGLDEAARAMQVGEALRLKVPAAAALGESARGPVPANTPFTMEVELLGIEP
jgi:FKBP-type peptidyl-prolyl cis-trans isomerase FkpA